MNIERRLNNLEKALNVDDYASEQWQIETFGMKFKDMSQKYLEAIRKQLKKNLDQET